MFRGQAQPADELLKQADLAMYQAKAPAQHGERLRPFDAGDRDPSRAAGSGPAPGAAERTASCCTTSLRWASTGSCLAPRRWSAGTIRSRGIVPPGEFISVAEDSGLILPLGRWILRTACVQLRAWSARPATASLSLAVNISARQFYDAQFVEQTLEVLEETGIDPRRLKLELTESLLIKNLDGIVDKMHVLMQRGIRFALDDFGTGYSSLSYLKRLPLEQLKIDRSFVRDLFNRRERHRDRARDRDAGQSLGMQVIAEGVEEERQWRFLESIGCQAFQGYFFGGPRRSPNSSRRGPRGRGRRSRSAHNASSGCFSVR